VVEPCIRSRADVERIEAFDPEQETGFLGDAIRLTRKELGPDVAIIGFCGAPFTTASYMIEGASSRNFENTKAMLHGDRELFVELVNRVVDALVPYLGMQVEAGADLLQIFDSWGGCLDAATYRDVLGDPMERLICTAKALGVPVTLYVNGCSHLLEYLPSLGPTVISIDWRVDPKIARQQVGDRCALQGNLDPAALFAPAESVTALTKQVLKDFGPEPGHIFNLGSGILPKTPLDSVAAMINTVKAGAS